MAKKNIPNNSIRVKIEKSILEELYLKKGLSQRECGEILGVSQTCISNHLKRNGIKIKPYSSYSEKLHIGEKNHFYGKKHSQNTKDIIGSKAKKRFSNPKNNPMYGKTHTPEARKRISDFRTGRPLSDETKRKISLAGIGRVKSQETRKKLSIANKGVKKPPLSEEHKEKIRVASTGRKHTEAHKKYMSELYRGEKHYNWKGGISEQYKRRWQGRKKDIAYRIGNSMSRGIRDGIKANKNGRHWESFVDYDLYDLKNHLEKQFQPGMTWDNYGKYGWHIDHKIPQSVFNFKTEKDIDFKRCFALSNLQPMWSEDNQSKGAKIDKPFQPSFAFGGALQ